MKDISADPLSTDDAVSSSSMSSPSVSDGSLLAMGDLTLDRSEETISPAPPVSELSTDPSPSTAGRKSTATKRYPSFRDLFKPLRGRSLSRSPDDRVADSESPSKLEKKSKSKKSKKKKKDKNSASGCAGWLEKKKKRKNSTGEPGSSSSAESSNGLSDLPPPLVTPQELEEDKDEADANCLKCSRCCRVDGPSGSKGVTYTKRPAGVDENDESWMCSECLQSLRRSSSREPEEDYDDDDDNYQDINDNDDDDVQLGVPFNRIAPLAHLALNVLIADVSYLVFSFLKRWPTPLFVSPSAGRPVGFRA